MDFTFLRYDYMSVCRMLV